MRGCFREMQTTFLYRLKGSIKEHFAGRQGCVTGDRYLSPELWNKFTAAHALTFESLRNAHGGGEGKTTCRFYYNDGIMSLGLL